jgi:hypothetical protein
MWVRKARRRFRLTLKPGHEIRVFGEVTVHDLECDHAVQTQINGLVNGGHPTPGEARADQIAPINRLPD